MRRTALQREDYEKAEHTIYNDLPTSVLYPVSKTVSYFDQSVVEKIILPGEEYAKITLDGYDHIVVTSFGRWINTKTIRQLKPSRTSNLFLCYISGTPYKSTEEFKRCGWEHNIQEIGDRYVEKGWRMFDARPDHMK